MTHDTPCISICVMAPGTNLCLGCGRTIDEISQWPLMATDQRLTIMALLLERMERAGLDPSAALRERLAGMA